MDPQACLGIALEHLRAGRFTDARRAIRDYQEWRSKDGFEPNLPTVYLGDVPIHGDRLGWSIRASAEQRRRRLAGETARVS